MKAKKQVSRLLSVLMALTLLVGLMPAALAADTVPTHHKSISGSGDAYTLTLNVTGKDKVSSSSSTTTTNGHADIVLVIDVTSSMKSTMSDGTTRLSAIQSAVKQFVSGLKNDSDSHITLITFGMTSNSGSTPVWTNQDWTSISATSKQTLNGIIDGLTLHNDNYSYDTTYAPGLNAANAQLDGSVIKNDGNNKYVIFFSDGDASDSQATINAAANAVKQKATVFSVGLPPAYWYESDDKIKSIASDANKYYAAANASAMVNAFNSALQIIQEETTVSSTPLSNVTISDTLSQYVELDGGFSPTVTLNGTAVASNKYTTSVNGKTVSVTYSGEVPDGEVLSVGFDVKPTQSARDAANAASTDSISLPSNDGATLRYFYGSDENTVPYAEEPQITLTKQAPSATTIQLEKTLTVNSGDGTVPAAGFVFEATPTNGGPAIGDVTISFSSSDTPDGNNQIVKTGSMALPDLSSFTGEGVFTYSIKEKPDTYAASNLERVQYDSAEYILSIKVCKTASDTVETDYTDGVNNGHVTLTNAADTSVKVDTMTFENTYTKGVKTTELTIGKTVTGNHADTSKAFDYTIVFTAANNAGTVKPTTDGATVEYGDAHSFQLKDGETITFTVPVGTGYTVTEAAAESYAPKAVVTTDGTENATPFTASAGSELKVQDQTTGEGENKVDFTNAYVDSPLTGLVENNAPFLIVLLLAVFAAAGVMFDRKRKRARG